MTKNRFLSVALTSCVITASTLMADQSSASIRTIPGQMCVRSVQRDGSGYWACPFVADSAFPGQNVTMVYIDFNVLSTETVVGKACRTRLDSDTIECAAGKSFTGPGGDDMPLSGGFAAIGNASAWDYYFTTLSFTGTGGAQIRMRGIAAQSN